jgi:molybdate transport system ATP-binding protein
MYEITVKKKLNSSQGTMLLDVHLNFEKRKFISICGKSGAGKTTLLKILAGLIEPEEGSIKTGDSIWFDKNKKINISPQKRKIGFAFQDYALFPNMTVKENLEFVTPEKQNNKRIKEILDTTGLMALASRFPSTLSGGQQQRVALARALVREPELLLLDEPFSSLDNEMRLRLQEEIAGIHRNFGLTTVLVSHDLSELYKLSDHIVEIDLGKIIKQSNPSEVFPDKENTGKIQSFGKVIEISQVNSEFILKVISGNRIIKLPVAKELAAILKPGDSILLVSDIFNPEIIKIN